LDIYPEVGLLDHIVFLYLIFGRTSILFSRMAEPIYIPTIRAQGFPFFTPLPTLVICRLLDDALSNRCEAISHCGLDLYRPDD